MVSILLASTRIKDFWFALPLIVVVSLVYAATRHELMGPILSHALRIGVWIVSFILMVLVVLLTISWCT